MSNAASPRSPGNSPLAAEEPWRRLRREAARRARAGDPGRSADLLAQAAEQAWATGDGLNAGLLRAEALACAGRLAEALADLEALWQQWPGDTRILHRLAAARRGFAQADWSLRPCAIHVVAASGTYRELAGALPEASDVAIEIGCAQGYATEMLARAARLVIAMDKSQEMVALACERLAALGNLRLLCADASDPNWPGLYIGAADVVFLDVGGSAPARQALSLMRDYRDLYLPRAVVVRNVELADFIGAVAYWQGGPDAEWRKPPIPHLSWPWCAAAE